MLEYYRWFNHNVIIVIQRVSIYMYFVKFSFPSVPMQLHASSSYRTVI